MNAMENISPMQIIAGKNGTPILRRVCKRVSVGDNYEGTGKKVINFGSTYIIDSKKAANESKRVTLILRMMALEDLLDFERSPLFDKSKKWWHRSFANIHYKDTETIQVVEGDWDNDSYSAKDLREASRQIEIIKNLITNFE